MDHDTLDRMRQHHAPSWLLAADQAPLIRDFLTLAFIKPNRRAIPTAELTVRTPSLLVETKVAD